MKNNKMKILDEIINLMDEEDGKRLMKHPKLVAAKVTVAKPITKKEGDEMMMDDELGEDTEHDLEEGPELEGIEDLLEGMPEEKKAKIRAMLK